MDFDLGQRGKSRAGRVDQHLPSFVNLDFEYELAAKGPYQTPPVVQKLCERWGCILRLLPPSKRGIELWGVTPRALDWARKLEAEVHYPSVQVVRDVNDKLTSHSLEKELGLALPHSGVIGSEEELRQAVGDCPHPWILKHPLGVSGRERMLGKAGILSDSALGWARRKVAQGWHLLFEPWVDKSREFSLHFEVEREGEVHFLGLCELLTDSSGVYRGNRISPGVKVPPRTVELGHRVIQALASQGYWGPVSLDSFEGKLGAETFLRPVVEINARYTFGRLALELGRLLPEDSAYSWVHPSASELKQDLFHAPFPSATESMETGTYRLPAWADPDARSGTYLKLESKALTSG